MSTNENAMSQDQQRALARVRKMLALANDAGASEGERDNAMRMAHATLVKHNLSMAMAETSGQTEEERVMNGVESSGHMWARSVCYSIAQLFFCENYSSRIWNKSNKFVKQYFVGRQSNAITAAELSQYVIDSINKEANLQKRLGGHDNAWHRSFCKGASHRVYYRCKALRAEAERAEQPLAQQGTGTSLVLASFYASEQKANQLVIQGNGVTVKPGKGRERNTDGDGYSAGKDYGDKVSLNRQLKDQAVRGQLK